MITGPQIYKGVNLTPLKLINKIINTRKWIPILHGYLEQLTSFNAKAPVLLFNKQYGRGDQLGRIHPEVLVTAS